MTVSDDYLLGALDAIEDLCGRCKALARAREAKDGLDPGYVEAMNEVALEIGKMLERSAARSLGSTPSATPAGGRWRSTGR